ncbi:MAG: DUF362 domain-containing protein [Armatimonadota bacterium]
MDKLITERRVGVVQTEPRYPQIPPYDPSEQLPEYQGPVAKEDNPAYRGVRAVMYALGLDLRRYGTPFWNPLSEIIRPEDTVVVKPNWVSHRNHGDRAYGLTDTDSLITHGSVLRAVLDYVCQALGGKGRVIIGDSPIQNTDWEALLQLTGISVILESMHQRFPGVDIEVRDFRLEHALVRGERIVGKIRQEPNPDTSCEVDLGTKSLLVPLMSNGMYTFGVANYPFTRMRRAHSPEHNLYLFPREVLEADVLINLPKVKTHCKAGITCALKNLVGINAMKDYLPHFRLGSPKNGGDEYPDGNWLWDLKWWLAHKEWERDRGILKFLLWVAERAAGLGLRVLFRYPRGYGSVGGGGWQGNDTLWRTILDINRALFYYDRAKGFVHSNPSLPIRYLAIADGLISGHRETPLSPTPIKTGWVLAGCNPVAMDTVVAALLGFDYRKIPQIAKAYEVNDLPLVSFGPHDVKVVGLPGISNVDQIYLNRAFISAEPSLGWRGYVEYIPEGGV